MMMRRRRRRGRRRRIPMMRMRMSRRMIIRITKSIAVKIRGDELLKKVYVDKMKIRTIPKFVPQGSWFFVCFFMLFFTFSTS